MGPAGTGRTIDVDDHVANLPGEAVTASEESTADDHATADTRAERHHDQVVVAPASAEGTFRHRCAVGIIRHGDLEYAKAFGKEGR